MKNNKRWIGLISLLPMLGLIYGCAATTSKQGLAPADVQYEKEIINEPVRVTPEEAYVKVKSGEALLVCAYEEEARCKRILLEDAMTLQEFESLLTFMPTDKEIIFYCT